MSWAICWSVSPSSLPHESREWAGEASRARGSLSLAQNHLRKAEGFQAPRAACTGHRKAADSRRLYVQEGLSGDLRGPLVQDQWGPGGVKAFPGEARRRADVTQVPRSDPGMKSPAPDPLGLSTYYPSITRQGNAALFLGQCQLKIPFKHRCLCLELMKIFTGI